MKGCNSLLPENQEEKSNFRSCTDSECGASLVEYALLIALITVVCLAAIETTGKTVSKRLSTLASAVEEA